MTAARQRREQPASASNAPDLASIRESEPLENEMTRIPMALVSNGLSLMRWCAWLGTAALA
jgi:hypothetical protein